MLLCVICHSYCHTVAECHFTPRSGGTTGTLCPGTTSWCYFWTPYLSHKNLSCLYRSLGLQEELIKAKLQGQILTQYDEFDCVPVVLPAVLDLADVFSGVGEREVADQ